MRPYIDSSCAAHRRATNLISTAPLPTTESGHLPRLPIPRLRRSHHSARVTNPAFQEPSHSLLEREEGCAKGVFLHATTPKPSKLSFQLPLMHAHTTFHTDVTNRTPCEAKYFSQNRWFVTILFWRFKTACIDLLRRDIRRVGISRPKPG
jgi:hypothetical protein